MNITVRRGIPEDVPIMVAVGKHMHEESAFSPISWDNEKTMKFGHWVISDENACAFCVEVDGERAGMILGAVQKYYFSQETQLLDFLWYVKPEYRGTQAAVELINAYIEFGKSKGCSEVNMQIGTNIHPEKTGELLKNLNFTSVGGTYVHSVT